MAPPFGKPISSVPDKELCSIHQIDVEALNDVLEEAKSNKSSYKAYKALLAHRRTLKCLKTSVNLQQEKANKQLSKAWQNIYNTEQDLDDVNDSPNLPDSTTRAPIDFGILLSILELQKLYHAQKFAAFGECGHQRGQIDGLLCAVNGKIKDVEKALMKEFRVRTVDHEGNVLEGRDLEHAIDAMASAHGINID